MRKFGFLKRTIKADIKLEPVSYTHLDVYKRQAYIRSTNQSIGLDEIVRTINNMEKGDLAALRFEEFNEQFQYLIGAALVLLLLEFLLLDRRNPLLRRFNIFGTDTGTESR